MRLSSLALIAWVAAQPAAATPSPASGDLPASDQRTDGRPGCRFEKPVAWTAGRISWLGGCHAGFAHGSGVLVNATEGEEPERFYGLVEHGHLRVGVLQSSGGLSAGTWSHGAVTVPLADDVAQRNSLIAAFRAAANAATTVSRSFAKKADAKSSRFYAKQAHLLKDQID